MVQGLDPVEAEQELQDHLLARPEAREMRLGPGRIDRQDGQVFGRRRGVCEPLDKRSRPSSSCPSSVTTSARTVPAGVRRPEPAHVDGAEGMARPTVRKPGLPVAALRGVRRPSRRIARSTTGPR